LQYLELTELGAKDIGSWIEGSGLPQVPMLCLTANEGVQILNEFTDIVRPYQRRYLSLILNTLAALFPDIYRNIKDIPS